MERQRFEDELKNAFQEAEVDPSASVWTNVELELEKDEKNAMRHKIFVYKMLAAASITFAMVVAGIGYYQVKQATSTMTIAANQQHPNPDNSTAKTTQPLQEAEGKIPAKDVEENKEVLSNGRDEKRGTISTLGKDTRVAVLLYQESKAATNVLPLDEVAHPSRVVASVIERPLPELYVYQPPTLKYPEVEIVEADPVQVMFAKLQALERKMAEEDQVSKVAAKEKLWTSVGFSAGGFSTTNPGVSQTTSFAATAVEQSKASGMAYSAGVSLGTSLSARWVLQGGFNYLTQLSDYTANEVLSADLQSFRPSSIKSSGKDGGSSRIATTPYTVNNNVQFISVPVQAGYLIINRKFGWQLNAGVATDLFLQNTIDPEGGNLEKTTEGPGGDSPYRTVNFSGMIGSELSYKLGSRYRLALNPGLRYPFSSIYKTQVGIEAMPLTFDLGVKFRYIFH